MSIHFITGNPGGGKGLLSMQKIVDELVHGERPIFTNLPVRVEPWVRVSRKFGSIEWRPEIGLRMYLLQKFGKDFDVRQRIFLLEDEKIPEFFLYRRNCTGIVVANCERDKHGAVDSFETQTAVANGGVMYVTDEAWNFWNSRKWQRSCQGILFYSAQHRHLGDTWYIVTQKTAQVDKALRDVAQDFAVVTNQGKLPFGGFRRPDIFTVCIYDQAPTGASLDPVKREVFKLDKAGLGACYDTAAGTNIGGGSGADIGERKKGLPWWIIPILLLAMAFGIWKLSSVVGWFTGRLLQGKKRAVTSDVTQSKNTAAIEGAPAAAEAALKRLQTLGADDGSKNQVNVVSVTNAVTVTAKLYGRDGWEIWLSDGRAFKGRSVQFVGERFCVVEGQSYSVGRPVAPLHWTGPMRPAPVFNIQPMSVGPERRTNYVYRPSQ